MRNTSLGNMRLSSIPGILFSGFFIVGAMATGAAASGYEFDGVGARSVARGGAVIADSPDWTAIYWNPANLAGAPRQASLELRGGGMTSKDGNSFNIPGVGNPFSKKTNSTNFIFGAAGAVVPLKDGSALGFGMYTPIMQGARFKNNAVPPVALFNSLDYRSQVVLAVGNVSYSRKLSDSLSAGAGADVLYVDLNTEAVSDFAVNPVNFAAPDVQTVKLKGSGSGLEGVAGLKYDYSETLSFGAVFRTGSGFRINGDATGRSQLFPDENTKFHTLLKHPPTSGIGAAWQAKRNLKLTCDFAQAWWKGFNNGTTYDTPGNMLVNSGNTLDWKNSYKFRAGALWAYNGNTDLMLGYAFDTPAIDKDSVDFSTAIDVPMHRFSTAVTKKWSAVEATLGALYGGGKRKAGGVDYSLSGWYLMSELGYRF